LSQPDLIERLRDARPAPPPALRERVRLIAAEAPAPPHRRITLRRAALVLVPVAAAITATVVFLPGGHKASAPLIYEHTAGVAGEGAKRAFGNPGVAVKGGAPLEAAVPAPTPARVQRYSASLELRLRSARAISAATKRAAQIASSLAGYPLRLNVHTGTSPSYADLVFRLPRLHVQQAVRRFAALGTIVNEDVAIQDLQAQFNASRDLMARLQRQLAALYRQPQTTSVQRQVAALTARVQRLQRGQTATLRAAHYATLELRLTTATTASPPVRHTHGPLHGLGIAFHWLWIVAVYTLALGAPVVAIVVAATLALRALRRRREEALLSRS
jgi:hypothetical protein